MPIRPDHYDYAFNPDTLDDLRKRLGLTQAALAEHLDVPVNTVSRWETGATTPNAKALAAIFSIAKERNVTPQFFKRRDDLRRTKNQPTQLLFVWDFQNHGLDASEVEDEWYYVRKYLELLFPKSKSNRRFWAYTSPHQRKAAEKLAALGFQALEGIFDADSQIIQDVRSAWPSRPSKAAIILVTDDGNFTNLVTQLKEAGVEVYVWGTDECSDRLQKAVSNGRYVHWDAPFVITECMEVIRELKGEAVTKSEFGNRCKTRLGESEIYPDDVGFSKRNPYAGVLRWLEVQGLVTITNTPGKPDQVTIKTRT